MRQSQVDERKAIRSAHKDERQKLVADSNQYHSEDARYIIKETRGQAPEDRRAALAHNREVHSGRLKDALHAQRQEHAEEHAAHQDEAAKERRDLAKSHRDTRKWMDRSHKAERREAITKLKQEIQGRSYDGLEGHEGLFPARIGPNYTERASSVGTPARMGRNRTHKAGSAEAILAHVLRQRGWTAQYDGASLTGKQHLSLLDDVRQYGRMWLRHEAESFFDRYGEEVERGLASRAAAAIGRFFDRARQFIREAIVAGAMALRGVDAFDESEQAALNHQVNIQRQYLDKFEREVVASPPREIADLSSQVIIAAPPAMTQGQFVARVERYGNAVLQVAQRINRGSAKRSQVAGGFVEERRVLGPAEHCSDCPPLAALKWQPIGTLPDIGDSECNGHCKCHFEYKSKDGRIFNGPLREPVKLKLKRIPNPPAAPKPEPKKAEPSKPIVPTLKELLEEVGSPYAPEEYEEA